MTERKPALTELHSRIDAARRAPQVGPPVRTGLPDVEAVVAIWRAARQPRPEQAAAEPDPGPRRRRWFSRR